MSPEYNKLADVPAGIQILVREEMERIEMEISVLSQTGFSFVIAERGDGHLVKIQQLCDLSESQIADGRKSTSNRYLIKPMNGRSNHDRNAVHHARLEDQIRSSRSSR